MTNSTTSARRSPLYPALVIILICAVIAIAAWTATSSPVLSLNSTPTPTHGAYFAFAQIAKPTYTPSPTVIPSPTAQPTNTPEPVVVAEIVSDSNSVYTAPNQD
ncbi:MAG TPA: hypothetical protein PLQ94_08540, partial [Anaerolineales bacterium]|nr:hypothetical protein [Anaerolineales bacterium]